MEPGNPSIDWEGLFCQLPGWVSYPENSKQQDAGHAAGYAWENGQGFQELQVIHELMCTPKVHLLGSIAHPPNGLLLLTGHECTFSSISCTISSGVDAVLQAAQLFSDHTNAKPGIQQ